jgi:EAL domain-containing protein (putative c-di-GMP-specific phosphodiesterase class I)
VARRLLILEHESVHAASIVAHCEKRGYCAEVTTTFTAFARSWSADVDLIILSLALSRSDGVEAIRFLGQKASEARLIITSDADPRILSAAHRLARARHLRVLGTIEKPCHEPYLSELLGRAHTDVEEDSPFMEVQLARDELRRCLEAGLLRVYFQPKIDVRNLKFVSVEALVRLDHPARGLLRPDAFLAMAEESGLIPELTEAVTRDAFTWASRWRGIGIAPKMAVNISPLLLSDLALPDTLLAWARALSLEPEMVILEVTETWLADDSIAALDTLTRLRLQGFQLSIDDFGTGYSTMAQLNEIPYGEMKLDQSFVRNAARDPEARAIVESSIELGHKLGMRVVAEGIERQEDWDLISDLNCDEGQGYFIARPMAPEELPGWLLHWNACLGGGALPPPRAPAVVARRGRSLTFGST